MAALTSVRSGIWRTAVGLSTPLLPSDYLDIFTPLAAPPRPGLTFRGRVEAVIPETRDAATLVIRTSRGWPGHIPGQYIRVGVDVDGVRLWRAYSITSGPRRDGRISITVKAMPDGRVSGHLVHRTAPGTLVQLDAPTGDFVLPAPLPAKVLFITAGSGITPVAGMLRHHLAHLADVVMLHSTPTARDFIFGAEIRSSGVRLVERRTDSDGMLGPDDIARLVPDWRERRTLACGPVGMLDDLQAHWADAGIADRLHTERFRAAIVAAGEGGRVLFETSDKSAETDGATPLLDAGERAGVLMPSGCRMGICYGCVLPLTSGAVRDLRTGALTTASEGDSIAIQTCISAAASDCVIRI